VVIDEAPQSLPQLTGAPAYVRPPTAMPEPERPFDPDVLPLLVDQTDEEREFTSTLPAHAWAPGGIAGDRARSSGSEDHEDLQARSFRLRAVAGRLIRGG